MKDVYFDTRLDLYTIGSDFDLYCADEGEQRFL
jgi:hypothetical protein